MSKRKVRLALVSMLTLLLLLASASEALGCTIFMVGKDASVDGSTMITVQQDTRSYPFELIYVPAKDHPEGATRKLVQWPQYARYFDEAGNPIDAEHQYIGVEIPEVPHTYAYMKSIFGVMNEHQVSMAMCTIYPRKELLNFDGKILMTELSFIALERAKTAREAIKVITELGEKYGFASEYSAGKNLVIADPNEIWQLCMWQVGPWDPESGKPGALWVAQRVPDDHVSCIPNGFPIGEIDLDNPDYYMASSNIFSVAIENGWWDPNSGVPFSVVEAYKGEFEGWSTASRKWRGYQLLAPSLDLPRPEEAEKMVGEHGWPYRYPFSVPVEKKISVADLNQFVQDTLEGTPYDLAKNPLGGPFGTWHRTHGNSFDVDGNKDNGREVRNYNTICNDSSQFTEICQMRNWLPNAIGGIVWWSPGPPKAGLRVPFYAGITEVNEQYGHELNQHFPANGFEWGKGAGWAAVFANTFADSLYSYKIQDIKAFKEEVESEARATTPIIDKAALALYEEDPAKAKEFLTTWSNQFAETATRKYWDLNAHLVWKYHNACIWEPIQEQSPKMEHEAWWAEQALEWQQEMEGR